MLAPLGTSSQLFMSSTCCLRLTISGSLSLVGDRLRSNSCSYRPCMELSCVNRSCVYSHDKWAKCACFRTTPRMEHTQGGQHDRIYFGPHGLLHFGSRLQHMRMEVEGEARLEGHL